MSTSPVTEGLYGTERGGDGGEDLPGSIVKSVALGFLMFACCLLTIVGNAMVLHAVRTERKLQTVCCF